MNDIIREACVETLAEAIYAAKHGVQQLEVCSHLSKDGLTPDVDLLSEIITSVRIDVKVMIRSREGDFYYSQNEIDEMIQQIQRSKALRIDGFVFGALEKNGIGKITLDIPAIYQLCKAASPYHVTIHKAIDMCDDILDEIIKLRKISNVKYILSSGGAEDAMTGRKLLKQMQATVGSDIQIIAAGKITPQNLNDIYEYTKLRYFHGRKIV